MAGYPQRDPYASGRGSLEDLLRDQNLDTGPDVQTFIENLMALQPLRQGITNEVDMGPDPYQGNEYSDEEYQIAGEVQPLYPHPVAAAAAKMRLQSPGVGARSQGMQSIENLGGPSLSSPYLDLMDVMMGRFPKFPRR